MCREVWGFESLRGHQRFLVVRLFQCPRGGIGRRAWFRSMCREVWGFESLRGHQNLPAVQYSMQYRRVYRISCPRGSKLCVNSNQCPRGGIGRRAWFRSMCREVWGFESLRGHQNLPCFSGRFGPAKRRSLLMRTTAFCVISPLLSMRRQVVQDRTIRALVAMTGRCQAFQRPAHRRHFRNLAIQLGDMRQRHRAHIGAGPMLVFPQRQ